MAVNPIQFLVAQNASITDGTKTITISGNVDCSRVYSGTAIFLGGADNPAEAVSGTSPDGSGNSTITLRNSWSQGDIVNQQLVSFNTNEGLAEAISNVREIVSNVSAIEDLATQGLIKRINDNEYEVVSISALGEALVGASDASSARTSLGLGTAATKNVGEAEGNVIEVGSFGLGSLDCPSVSNLETQELASGLYKFRADIVGAPPETSATSFWYSLLVTQSLQERVTFLAQVVTGGSPRIFIGERIGISGAIRWEEIYNSGNSVNPLNHGIGSTAASNSPETLDLNSVSAGGIYRIEPSTANKPSGFGSYGTLLHEVRNNSGGAFDYTQTVTDIQSRRWFRVKFTSGWSPWNEIYHSGNSVNPLNIGLGIRGSSTNISNFDSFRTNNAFVSGAYTYSSGAVDSPSGLGANGTVLFLSRATSDGTLLAIDTSGNLASKAFDNSGGVSGHLWNTFYHSGNANFNEFGGSAGDFVATGAGFNASTIWFYLPINSSIRPTGITVSNDFQLVNSSNSVIQNNVIPSFNVRSGFKVLVLELSGLSGIVAGDFYALKASSSSSKITVNF